MVTRMRMSPVLLAIWGLLGVLALVGMSSSVSGAVSPLREFDSLVSDLSDFATLLELQSSHEVTTNDHLEEEELAFLEMHANAIEEAQTQAQTAAGDAPTYTLPYPPITYANTAAGGFVHPYTNLNPLAAPFGGFAPTAAGPVPSPAAYAASPITSLYYGAGAANLHAALGMNPALFPANAAGGFGPNGGKGGYNVHGFPADVYGRYHPNLAADLKSLGGKAGTEGEAPPPSAGGDADAGAGGDTASLLEADNYYPLAGDSHNPANIDAGAANVAYGLYPAPAAGTQAHFDRSSDNEYMLGPHKLQFAPVGTNKLDADFPAGNSAFVEMDGEMDEEVLQAEQDIDADIEAMMIEAESEFETESDSDNGSDTESDDHALLESGDGAGDLENEEENEAADLEELDALMLQIAASEDPEASGGAGGDAGGAGGGDAGGDAGAGGEKKNPTYVLPYPPVLPGHYSPLFNPYTNVNPLSTPYANYAAQPGAHPQVAAIAAAHASNLAIVHGQIAGQAGGYPYYPFAARDPYIAAQLQGNPIYPGAWIHPQNLNSAAVGDNAGAASLGQFLEVATEMTEQAGCVGCTYE